ncbi:NAD-binding protein [Glacieibacterium megasporae]|uniref:NAD-binding protein n=1 Tax=Glacieibacterium megasporae TaxID=2835787 RepID=UPI001C1E1635|nr:NAD-binding protein [Polymorphobacter megasporae]
MATSTPEPSAIAARSKAVLVSGASFAGLATAYWLNRLGYSVTIVETANELRRGGTPVDIEGETNRHPYPHGACRCGSRQSPAPSRLRVQGRGRRHAGVDRQRR